MSITNPRQLSRRDVLKLSGAALLGLFLAGLKGGETLAAPATRLGRVLYGRMKVRDGPSFSGGQVGSLLFDNLVDLAEAVEGGETADGNRTWYRLENGGFVYSGGIQVVRSELNEVVNDLPEGGVVGEVSVPYADSVWGVNRSVAPGPRLYYQSTHWVTGLVVDGRDGSTFYKCYDNLWQSHYYTRPQWVRILGEAEMAPITPLIPAHEKLIEISLEAQMLYAFEGEALVYAARASTGQRGFETPTGWFRSFHKRPTYHMTGGYDDASIFDLPGVPWDSYLTESGVAIHGTYWHNDFGNPHSHGCINLLPKDARWVYRWTTPVVAPGEKLALTPGSGTHVHILQARIPNRGARDESSI